MLQLLIILAGNKANPYIRSIIMQLLVILHQKQHNLPAWQILKRSLSLFNEEAGEMSFSVLSRCVLGDTIKHKLEYMNNMYASIHFMQEVDVEMREDNGKKFTQDHNYRKNYDENSEEVLSAREFIKGRMREVYGNGAMTQYDGSGKKPKAYQTAELAQFNQLPMTRKVPLWDIDVFKQLDKHIEQCKEFMWNTNFGQKHVFLWPEMVVSNEHIPQSMADNIHDDLDAYEPENDHCQADDNGNSDEDSDDSNDDDKGVGKVFVRNHDQQDSSDSDSSLDSSSHSPSQSPIYSSQIHARQSSQSGHKSRQGNTHRRAQGIEPDLNASDSSESSSEAGGAEDSDDESVQDSGGAVMGSPHNSRSRSVAKTPEVDRTSWSAPNQSDHNPINIISSNRKRSRKQTNSYVYINTDDDGKSSESD
jgi:hypothetical protein